MDNKRIIIKACRLPALDSLPKRQITVVSSPMCMFQKTKENPAKTPVIKCFLTWYRLEIKYQLFFHPKDREYLIGCVPDQWGSYH